MIRFNDEINNVKTERKRKTAHIKQEVVKPNNLLRDGYIINNPDRRKGAQSLYTNVNPLNIENRVRIESNYTTRSGERLGGDINEIGSVKSARKKGGSSNKGARLTSKKSSKTGQTLSKDFKDLKKNESPLKKT